jgi:putative intracellular protease/amidase
MGPASASRAIPWPGPPVGCGAGQSWVAPGVTAAGAEFVDGAAVIDGQMVSARAWPDHPAWMREGIAILRLKSPA